MLKNLSAWLRGYVVFRVEDDNGARLFATYSAAKRHREASRGNVSFTGWAIFRGWRGFYIRWVR